MKYVVLAVLLFAPLAVAGTYLSRDPTSTEVPRIELRTKAPPAVRKPERNRPARPRKRQARRPRVGATPVVTARTPATPPPAARREGGPQPSRSPGDDAGADDSDRPAVPRTRGAEPVPEAPPATAGPEPENDEPDDGDGGGGGGDDDGDGDD